MSIEPFEACTLYDKFGQIIGNVSLPERIFQIPGRRNGFGESGLYYKGIGTVYRNHYIYRSEPRKNPAYITISLQENMDPELTVVGHTKIVYENTVVTYPKCIGKRGIFTFQHQPCFSDYEGACGPKEAKLIENQKIFERSAIDSIESIISIPEISDHKIYALRMKDVKGNLKDTVSLMEYLLGNDWNTAWDKNVWDDIFCYGYIRDVADWFQSKEYVHKLGTIFSILHSMYQKDIRQYAELLLLLFGECDFEKRKIVYYSARVVQKYCKCEIPVDIGEWNDATFLNLFHTLSQGMACCHLENDAAWNWVRKYFGSMQLANENRKVVEE